MNYTAYVLPTVLVGIKIFPNYGVLCTDNNRTAIQYDTLI